MSSQIRLERDDYYRILERSQKGPLDITPWILWFLGCLGRALRSSGSAVDVALARSRFWESHAGQSFNDRQRKVLNRLLDGLEGKLTTTKWARLAKCSQDTAGRDINDLISRGILRKDPAGGRSTSYSLAFPPGNPPPAGAS
jgi:Fic family protein